MQPQRTTCPGSGQLPKPGTIAHRVRDNNGATLYAGRGICQTCGADYKLTFAGRIRIHRGEIVQPPPTGARP